MRSHIRQDWLAWLMGSIALVGATSAINLVFEIGKPFGGFKAVYALTTNEWSMDTLTPPWWPAPILAGLRANEQFVSLDGHLYGDNAEVIYAQAYQRGVDSVALIVKGAGNRFERDVPVGPFTFLQFLDIKLPEIINGLGFWLVAVAIYRARPDALLNRVFALSCAMIAGGQLLTINSVFGDVNESSRALTFIWILIIPWIGALIAHFVALFPEPASPRIGSMIRILYGLSFLVAASYAVSLWTIWHSGWSWMAGFLGTIGWQGAHALFFIGILFYVIRFGWHLTRPNTSPRTRRQLLFTIGGLVLAGPYIATTLLHGLTAVPHSHFWRALDVRYLLLAAPLAFAFVVVRYQTFQSKEPLLMGVALMAGSALAASLGAWLIYWFYPGVGGPPFPPVFGVMLATSLFWSVQVSNRGLFGRLLQWEQANYRAAHRFGQRVVKTANPAAPSQILAATLVAELELERAALWVWRDEDSQFTLAGQSGDWRSEPPAHLEAMAGEVFTEIARLRNGFAQLPGWLAPLENTAEFEIACPLWAAGELVGLLGLGKRWDEEIFDERDLEIIELIAQQSALFLLTAQHIERLSRVPRQVAEAQERERRKIARELHDHTEQFLASLSLNLAVSQKTFARDPERANGMLQQCLEEVEDAAKALRQIRSDLAPRQLEKGLALPLNAMLDRFRLSANVETRLKFDADLGNSLSPDARHAVYRVIQQALDNVAEHARAQSVTVSLARNDSRAVFAVEDDGCGFSESRRAQARAEDCFGLDSMQDRITLLGGELTIDSTPGAGTRVWGWLPM